LPTLRCACGGIEGDTSISVSDSHFVLLASPPQVIQPSSSRAFDLVLDQAVTAWGRVVARHPLMRSFVHARADGALGGRVYRAIAAEYIRASVTIHTPATATEWQTIVLEKTHEFVNYAIRAPFSMVVLRPAPGEDPLQLRVLIFSPHHASDGFSGIRALHDWLSFVATTPEPPAALTEPLCVQRPLLHRWFGLSSKPATSALEPPQMSCASALRFSWSRLRWWARVL
jgi:hypothetical protein